VEQVDRNTRATRQEVHGGDLLERYEAALARQHLQEDAPTTSWVSRSGLVRIPEQIRKVLKADEGELLTWSRTGDGGVVVYTLAVLERLPSGEG